MIKTYSRACKPREIPLPSEELPVEYENSCRLCLEKQDDMVTIYDGNDIIPVPVKIRTCISIEVSEDDGLPKMICRNCHDQLEHLYRFKKRCLATDVKLRQLITIPRFRSDLYETPDVNILDIIHDDGDNEETIRNACTLTDFDDASHVAPIFKCTVEKNKSTPLKKPLCISNVHSMAENNENNNNNKRTVTEDGTAYIELEADGFPQKVNTQRRRNENISNDMNIEHIIVKEEIFIEDITNDMDCSNIGAAGVKEVGIENSVKNSVKRNRKNQRNVDCEDMSLIQRLEILNCSGTNENSIMTRQRRSARKLTENSPFFCSQCNEEFSTTEKHKAHMLKHSVGKICDFCSKLFVTKSLLLRHLRVHTGERPFECDVCKKCFSQKEILVRHKSLHIEGRPHICSICDKAYALPEALKSHARLKHPQKRVVYKCKKCDKVFRHPSGLSRHQHKHFGTVFSCKVCNKSFDDMTSTKKHLSKHVGVINKTELKSYISKTVCRNQELQGEAQNE